MKDILFITCLLIVSFSCKKAQIKPTEVSTVSVPWSDTSNVHPKNAALTALLEKFYAKGLPGISLLVNDVNGTWVGSIGKADIERDIPFEAGQVSNLVTGSGNSYGGMYSNIFDLYTFIDALLLKKNLLSAKSLGIMLAYGKPDGINQYGYGLMKKFISRGIDAGFGHSGRDLGYTANVFYFPNKSVTHAFLVNYGTDAKSNLREIFNEFQEELLNLTLQ